MSDFSKNYREVNVILNLLGDNFKNKVPKKMIDFFDEFENKNYNPEFTLDDVFAKKIDDNTSALITMMYINYWTSSNEEKNEYMDLLRKKDEEYIEKHKLVLHEVFPNKDLLYEKLKETDTEMAVNKKEVSTRNSSGMFVNLLEKFKNIFMKK